MDYTISNTLSVGRDPRSYLRPTHQIALLDRCYTQITKAELIQICATQNWSIPKRCTKKDLFTRVHIHPQKPLVRYSQWTRDVVCVIDNLLQTIDFDTMLNPVMKMFEKTGLGTKGHLNGKTPTDLGRTLLEFLSCKLAYVWMCYRNNGNTYPDGSNGKTFDSQTLELSPPPYLDQIWHHFLLNPVEYSYACSCLFNLFYCGSINHTRFTSIIPHNPLGSGRSEEERVSAIIKTQTIYCQLFQQLKPGARNGMEMVWSIYTLEEPRKGGYQVFINELDGSVNTVYVNANDSIYMLKCMTYMNNGISPCSQRLIFNGKQLEDSRSVSDYNIQSQSTIHLVLRLRGC
uniref:Ubiquitin-like domain-containing protein n=1 Tax=viral metagenome TaxID=1070528 RepID=A0A6C0CLC1_9ZZZZ